MFPISCNAVGDIIALVQLACQIVTALNESRGAQAECRELFAQLTSIAHVLEVSRHTIDSLRIDALRKIVDEQLASTSRYIQDGLGKVARFSDLLPQATTGRPTLGDRAMTTWSCLKWEFLGKADVKACRDDFARAFQPLTFALFACVRTIARY